VVTGPRRRPLFPGSRLGCACVSGLCRYTPSAVWVTRSRLGERAKLARGVVASLGGANGQVKCEGLNAKILKTAANVAKAEGSELHIVHAVSPHGGEGLNGQRPKPDAVAYLSELRGEIRGACNAVLADLDLSLAENRIHLASGSPTAVIPEVVKEQGLDPIVMGTHARDGISGLWVRDTAERVMTRVDCGVMVVKPDDFVSLVAREEGVCMQERKRDRLSDLNGLEDSPSHGTLGY
jgi:universal stress protein E